MPSPSPPPPFHYLFFIAEMKHFLHWLEILRHILMACRCRRQLQPYDIGFRRFQRFDTPLPFSYMSADSLFFLFFSMMIYFDTPIAFQHYDAELYRLCFSLMSRWYIHKILLFIIHVTARILMLFLLSFIFPEAWDIFCRLILMLRHIWYIFLLFAIYFLAFPPIIIFFIFMTPLLMPSLIFQYRLYFHFHWWYYVIFDDDR